MHFFPPWKQVYFSFPFGWTFWYIDVPLRLWWYAHLYCSLRKDLLGQIHQQSWNSIFKISVAFRTIWLNWPKTKQLTYIYTIWIMNIIYQISYQYQLSYMVKSRQKCVNPNCHSLKSDQPSARHSWEMKSLSNGCRFAPFAHSFNFATRGIIYSTVKFGIDLCNRTQAKNNTSYFPLKRWAVSSTLDRNVYLKSSKTAVL